MVDLLCELGYEASVFHGTPGFRCSWFDNTTPVVAKPFLELEPGDLLVVPEYDGARKYERCRDAAVVHLNQNHFRTFINAGFDDSWPGAYPGWPNAKAVLVTSEAVGRFISAALRAPLPVYPTRVVVDSDRFLPGRKRKLVALMPRKRRHEAEAAVQLIYRGGLAGWEVAVIDKMSHGAVADVLSEAAIFLSFSSEEGFGLPPAEAMAAGCYVIGYTGDGGREFMDPSWCSPIGDEDIVAIAQETLRVANDWDRDAAAVQARATQGREFVSRRYTREGLREDLATAFEQLAAPGSDARQPSAVSVTHWSVPIGPRGTLVRAKGRVARSLRNAR
ncbi:MAG TPA: glycosyltransferase [Acidimicrobiia bacterium]|nr:glycosyltransferase [Acidimicrobiia bacterium]